MAPKELIEEIRSLYENAHIPLYKHERIFRGESRPISSAMEDLFAKYLIEQIPSESLAFINQIITNGSCKNRIRVKPDIMIVRNNEIKALIDLKMDLGYKRNEFLDFWRKRDALLSKMRGKSFHFNKTDGYKKSDDNIYVSKTAMLYFIIISDQNINSKNLNSLKEKKDSMKNSKLYFLFEGIHPNDPDSSLEVLNKHIDHLNKTLELLNSDLRTIIK